MSVKNIPQRLLLTLSIAAIATPAFATNGYFANGYGTRNKGMSGAGVALPQDSLAPATNPAGMAFVGARADLGVALFSPSPRSYTTRGSSGIPEGTVCGAACPFDIGPQSIESENDFFLVPHFGYNLAFGNTAFGIAVYGNGGMDTEYRGGTATFGNPATGAFTTFPGTFGDGTAGINLEQLFIAPTYASKWSATGGWGISPLIVYQRFQAFGIGSFAGFSSQPNNVSDKGTDSSTGIGLRLGAQGNIAPGVTLAAAYQPQINMSKFSAYKGLFAEGGDFDIPANGTAGIAWNVTPTSYLAFDVRKIWYSDVDSLGNTHSQLGSTDPTISQCMASPTGGSGRGCLGGSKGAGFGWEDITVYKLGYQWQTSNEYTWRVGASVGDQPIQKSEVLFNILAPAVNEKEVSFGFTKAFSKSNALSFAFTYALDNSLRGRSPFSPSITPGGGQTIELQIKQYDLEVSWAWIF